MNTCTTERRQFFRIDDYVRLTYSLVSDLKGLPGDGAERSPQNRQQLRETLEAELNNSLNALWRDYPLAARALSLLNRKLDLLGTQIDDVDLTRVAAAADPVQVNISGSGIAFTCDSMFSEGQLLDLEIVLLPSEAQLRIMARVIDADLIPGADETDARPYMVRAEFALRDTAAQETLISHIVQREQAQRSEQR